VKVFDYEPDEVLRPEQEVKAEQEAAMQANQEPQEPDIKFDKIKFELLPPQIQAMILQAGMVQNEVKPDGSNDGAAPAGPAGSPASLQNPTGNSVMPGAGINQAPPPMEGGTLPPATPVQPISESQGGPT